jgi:hypothetical protein
MEFGMAYHRANAIADREIRLLFQRFHFFLIGTGILFAAYAALVTGNGLSDSIYSKYIPTLVASVGLGFSIIIASINYFGSRMIFKIGSYINALESIPVALNSIDSIDSKITNNSCLIEDITMLPQNHISNITKTIINEGILLRMIPPLFVAELCGNIILKLKDPRIPLITASQYTFFLPFLLANVWLGVLGSITSIWAIFICFMVEVVAFIIFFVMVIALRVLPPDAFSHLRSNVPLP